VRYILLSVLLVAFVAAGCRQRPSHEAAPPSPQDDAAAIAPFEEEALTGRVEADGSSTVAPLMTLAAETFRKQEPGVKVSVGVSGTGGGFERFCRGETDLSDASRPIEDDEKALCAKHKVDFLELRVANDGIAVAANTKNDWAKCLTLEQLKKIWEPGSNVGNWKQVDSNFPDEPLKLFGAGTDSGTFDYFTEAIVGEEGKSRSDYQASENDNVLVSGVAGEKGALGYFGLSYFEQNKARLKAVEVDGGDGCVAPSAETVQDGSYRPLSRPLFIYVKKDALERRAVDAFVQYVLDHEPRLARRALFVPLTPEQLDESRSVYAGAGVG
jgi:phosphate transport system substrate-binding protein